MPVTLHEPFRAVFYAPFYLSFALKAYAAEGLDVRFAPSDDDSRSKPVIFTGEDAVMWGGPLRLLRHHDADPQCPFVGFCEVVTRDPFFLIGRSSNPSFRFADLMRCRVGCVSEVPTPWMCLQEDIRRSGIDPTAIDRISDRAMPETIAMLSAGELDVVQVFEPFVEHLVRSGVGHIWYAAADRGPTSYTTLIASRALIECEPELLLRMTRALHRTLSWLHAADGLDIAEAVIGYFPDHPADVLAAAIDRYKRLRVWGRDTRLPVVGFVRLKSGLLSGGFMTRDVPYEACVEPSFANAVLAEAATRH